MGLFDIIKKKLFGEKKEEPKDEIEKKPAVIKEEKPDTQKSKEISGNILADVIKKEEKIQEVKKAKEERKKEKVLEKAGAVKKIKEEKIEKKSIGEIEKKPEEKRTVDAQKTKFSGNILSDVKKKIEEPRQILGEEKKTEEIEEPKKEIIEEGKEEKIEESEAEREKSEAIERKVARIEEEVEAKITKKIEEKKEESKPKRGLFQTISTLFTHSAKQVVEQVVSKVTDKVIDEELFSELFKDFELFLLEANVAFDVIDEFRERLKMRLLGKKINRKLLEESVRETLRDELLVCFRTGDNKLIEQMVKETDKPFVILFIGINGSGKTTSIAKLAQRFLKNKLSVVFGAADTFRAAAQEQLEVHAERLRVPVIKQNYGADPAAVAFDAIAHAKAKSVDVVLIDSAGRLNTNENLIRELEKIKRVAKPNLTILVSEALSGADVLEQARVFCERVGIDFNIVTKLDATTKWGGLISIAHQTKKPIMFVGKGQEYEDLEVFEKGKFIDELLGGI